MVKEAPIPMHPYNFQLIPVGKIGINHLYQRDAVRSTVKNIVGNFDYHKINCIKCVLRDGNYFAFDGQNTALGLTMLFGAKYLAPVLIYDDIGSPEEEAKLFEEINKGNFRKAATIADDLKAKLFRQDPCATGIRKIAQTNGLDFAVGENKGKSGMIPSTAYKYLSEVYTTYGEAMLSELLSILGGAWKYDKYAFKKPVIKGMVAFIDAYRGAYDKYALISRLNRNSAKDLCVSYQISKNRSYKTVAGEILAIYNKGTSVNRLPDKL